METKLSKFQYSVIVFNFFMFLFMLGIFLWQKSEIFYNLQVHVDVFEIKLFFSVLLYELILLIYSVITLVKRKSILLYLIVALSWPQIIIFVFTVFIIYFSFTFEVRF